MSDDYDYPPPRRLQPATKFVSLLIGVVSLISIVAVIVIVASRPDAVTTKAASRTETPKTARKAPAEEAPTSPLVSEETSRAAWIIVFAVVVLVVGGGYVVLIIFVGAWIARDAAARGMEAGAWVLVFLLPHFLAVAGPLASPHPDNAVFLVMAAWMGLLVYVYGRRRGWLAHCDQCGNKHLHYAACPHCGPRAPAPTEGIIPPPRRR